MSSPENDPPAPSKPSSGAAAPTATDFRAKARQAKLRIALSALRANKLNTAAAMLLELYHDERGTPEAEEAGAAVSALADAHEAAGRHRMAADLYAKLAD